MTPAASPPDPQISVVMPARDAAKTLREAVDSLLAHTASLTSTLAAKDEVIGKVIDNLNAVLTTVNARGDKLSALISTLQELSPVRLFERLLEPDGLLLFTTQGRFIRNQFGGTFGGPVPLLNRGDKKTFFFVDYEGTSQRQAQTFQLTTPTNLMQSSNFTNFSELLTQGGTQVDRLGRRYAVGTIFDPATSRLVPGGSVDPVTGMTVSGTSNAWIRDPIDPTCTPLAAAETLFEGETSTGRMKRSFAELAAFCAEPAVVDSRC